MPSQNVEQTVGYTVYRQSLRGPTKGTISVSATGTDLVSKRDRSWSVQQSPFVKTLGYSDQKTEFSSNAYEWLKQNKLSDSKWYDDSLYTCASSPGTSSDLAWLVSHTMLSADEAKHRVIEQAGGITWSLPVFAAEAGKTSDMMFNAAKTIVKAYKQARRGNFRGMLKTFGLESSSGISSNWLGYRYGVCTTLLDVQSMAQAAAETLVERPQVQKVICRGPSQNTIFSGKSSSLGRPLLLSSEMRAVDTQIRLETKAWLTVSVSNQTLLTMNQFGLANPALVAWELVPLSFVADWAIGIGDWLAAQTGLLGLKVLDGGFSQLSSRELYARNLDVTSGNIRSVMRNAPCVHGRSRKYFRSPWDGAAPPLRLGFNMSTRRFVDAAALIRGFVKSL